MSVPIPTSCSSRATIAGTLILLGVLVITVWLTSLRMASPAPIVYQPAPRGIPGTASDPADTWVKKPYVSTGFTPLKNEYGIEINSRDPVTHTRNMLLTDCAHAAGIHDRIDPQQMLTLMTCVASTPGR